MSKVNPKESYPFLHELAVAGNLGMRFRGPYPARIEAAGDTLERVVAFLCVGTPALQDATMAIIEKKEKAERELHAPFPAEVRVALARRCCGLGEKRS